MIFEQMPKEAVIGMLVSCKYIEVDRGMCVLHTCMYLYINRTGS